jgi:hypothetical protein
MLSSPYGYAANLIGATALSVRPIDLGATIVAYAKSSRPT